MICGFLRPAKCAAVVATALLAGCTGVQQSPSAGPASGPTSPILAGQLFAEVCIAPQPSFAASPGALAARGFTQNSITKTYYLTTENLSIKLIDSSVTGRGELSFDSPANPDTCSIVFATDVDADTAVSQMAQGTASVIPNGMPPGITISSNRRGALTYINARITAQ